RGQISRHVPHRLRPGKRRAGQRNQPALESRWLRRAATEPAAWLLDLLLPRTGRVYHRGAGLRQRTETAGSETRAERGWGRRSAPSAVGELRNLRLNGPPGVREWREVLAGASHPSRTPGVPPDRVAAKNRPKHGTRRASPEVRRSRDDGASSARMATPPTDR